MLDVPDSPGRSRKGREDEEERDEEVRREKLVFESAAEDRGASFGCVLLSRLRCGRNADLDYVGAGWCIRLRRTMISRRGRSRWGIRHGERRMSESSCRVEAWERGRRWARRGCRDRCGGWFDAGLYLGEIWRLAILFSLSLPFSRPFHVQCALVDGNVVMGRGGRTMDRLAQFGSTFVEGT